MPKAKVYIKRLVLNGPQLPEASVDFEKGVNLIIGPSNTGKSLIIDCINYIFSWLPKKNDPRFRLNDMYGYETIRGFEDKLISILTNCSFPGAESARFTMEAFDVQFGSRKKSSTMGGGYCGIINTMVALSLMEYLLESGTYAPGMMLVDSPLSQLSESEYISDAETIKESFIHYLLYNKREGQIILVEQKDKMPEMIKSGAWSEDIAVKVIEFTKNKEHGRYGLLPGVYDLECTLEVQRIEK